MRSIMSISVSDLIGLVANLPLACMCIEAKPCMDGWMGMREKKGVVLILERCKRGEVVKVIKNTYLKVSKASLEKRCSVVDLRAIWVL